MFRGKMHSDWFNGIEILQSRWQYGETVGYSYPSGFEKTLCKWDIYVPLVTKRLNNALIGILHNKSTPKKNHTTHKDNRLYIWQ